MLNSLQKNITRTSAQNLVNLANWAEEHKIEGPSDLSMNHDKYLYEK
jgi:hypothetical protein